MVYTSTSIALAAVELFVNTDPFQAPDDLIVTEAILPAELKIDRLNAEDSESMAAWELCTSRRLGSEWIRALRSAALRVPSAAAEGDWNILLNPEHPAFASIQQLPPKPWHFDPRMFQREL